MEARQFPGRYDHDITMFNWPGNDYRDMPLVDQEPEDLGPRAAGRQEGESGVRSLAPDRGSRRAQPAPPPRPDGIAGRPGQVPVHPGVQAHQGPDDCRGTGRRRRPPARSPGGMHFDDSVGVGWYPIDIHQAGEGDVGTSTRTKPFQIPLGALIPVEIENLIAANKNICTTHITNGCYRLHPVEWNIGEAAGLLASFCMALRRSPRSVHGDRELLRSFQREAASDGVPLSWLIDVPVWSPDFAPVQLLVQAGGYGPTAGSLMFDSEEAVRPSQRAAWIAAALGPSAPGPLRTGRGQPGPAR